MANDHTAIGDWAETVDVQTPADAIAARSEAVHHPPTARDLEARAVVRMTQGELDASLADLDEAIRLDPGDAVARNDRGNGWWWLGQYAKARADYDEAVRSEPGYLIAYNNRA